MPKNILVTGGNGQLGGELRALSASSSHCFFFTDRTTLDITDKNAVEKFCAGNAIDTIINCAAYTAVDKAEGDSQNAHEINTKAVEYLCVAAKNNNARLIHISTDFVFDGKKSSPYNEEDETAPMSVYGMSKRDGEEVFLASGANGAVVRTSWLYSSFGSNFVKTMMKYGKERGALRVVCDQIGTPTYARDLARAVLLLIDAEKLDSKIYHYSNEGVASWYDFAHVILQMSNIPCELTPIATHEYPTPACRPTYSVLNKTKIKSELNIQIPHWADSLRECLSLIKEQQV